MNVDQAIKVFQRYKEMGFGEAELKSYSELSSSTYVPVAFTLRLQDTDYNTTDKPWIEVL